MKKLLLILSLALILCFMVGCQNKEAMAELEEFKAQAEIEAKNIEIVKRFYEELSKANLDIFEELLAPNFVYFSPSGIDNPSPREDMIEGMKNTFKAFPDLHYEIKGIFADNNIVVVSTLGSATHEGEFMGIPPSGNKLAASAIAIMQVEEDKIVKEWTVVDNLSLMMQLGMELKPKEAEK